MLRVDGLTRRFGGITAVDDVTFDLAPRQILGLIGPNGAGKTTIFDLISGLLPANGGRIFFRGSEITDWGNSGASGRWFRQWTSRMSSDVLAAGSEYFSNSSRSSTIGSL